MNGLQIVNDAVAWLNPELCWRLVMALLHSVWQGILLACIVAVVVRSKIPVSVHHRFVISFLLLVLIGFTPVINFLWMSRSHELPRSIAVATQQYHTGNLKLFPIAELDSDRDAISPLDREATMEVERLAESDRERAATTVEVHQADAVGSPASGWAGWSVVMILFTTMIYLVGATSMFIRLVFGLKNQWRVVKVCGRVCYSGQIPPWVLLAAERAAASLGRTLRTPVVLFNGSGAALVIGCLRPVILINATLVSGLTPEQLQQVLAHELAHVYRFDPWTQICQRLIEAVLFFHPAVWFVSRTVSDLRELCCDELVAGSHSRLTYAETLMECAAMSRVPLQPGALPVDSMLHAKIDSSISLAAIGTRSSQLAIRIKVLLDPVPTRVGSPAPPITWRMTQVAIGIVVMSLAIALGVSRYQSSTNGAVAASVQQVEPDENDAAVLGATPWDWHKVDPAAVDLSSLWFGGLEVRLVDEVPADVEVEVMVVEADCKFAQWQFGDFSSTRVAILVELDQGRINRVFLDTNRNRIIEADEQVTAQTSDEKSWIADLNVEVGLELSRDDQNVELVDPSKKGKVPAMNSGLPRLHAGRQVAIKPNRRLDAVKLFTLGYASGQIELNGADVAVRRYDFNGNGIPNDANDQIWFDFDHNSDFDLIHERKRVGSVMEINGQRYAIRSDRLGQSLKLTPNHELGQVRFRFELDDPDAVLETLEGVLRDDSGLFLAVRLGDEPVDVPPGRYCLETLVVQVRDADDATWRMTLKRGVDRGWFDVNPDQLHELKLLESLEFSVSAQHQIDSWTGQQVLLQPTLVTPNGLIVTNFSGVVSTERNQNTSGEGQVRARFVVQDLANVEQRPKRCSSAYG